VRTLAEDRHPVSVSDIGVIYSAVLSTATAVFGGRRWWRGRKLSVSFSYGWSESRGEPATLTIRVHNDSPLRTIREVCLTQSHRSRS